MNIFSQKFKGLNTDSKWVVGDLRSVYDDIVLYGYLNEIIKNENQFIVDSDKISHKVDDKSIRQLIPNLKDKNDNEIFLGDRLVDEYGNIFIMKINSFGTLMMSNVDSKDKDIVNLQNEFEKNKLLNLDI